MKAYGGVDVQIQIFFTSALAGGVVSFTPRPFYPQGESPKNQLDRRLGGPQSQSGYAETRKFLTLQGLKLRPLSCPTSHYTDYTIPVIQGKKKI
jgi:hypothetical protein